jgi:hypothetical protein
MYVSINVCNRTTSLVFSKYVEENNFVFHKALGVVNFTALAL